MALTNKTQYTCDINAVFVVFLSENLLVFINQENIYFYYILEFYIFIFGRNEIAQLKDNIDNIQSGINES